MASGKAEMANGNRAAVYVNLSVLEENYRIIRSRVDHRARLLCVVKADAYGHGAFPVSQKLESIGADYLGVAGVYEGVDLREKGITKPILVMGGILPWDSIRPVVAKELTVAVHDFPSLHRIAEESPSFPGTLKIHLKFDTGMGRLGFLPSSLAEVLEVVKTLKNIYIEGVMSHLASSELRDDFGLSQVRRFEEIIRELGNRGIVPEISHIANSGAITVYPEAHKGMVRAGISLYGSHSDIRLAENLPVKQVMSLLSRVAGIRELQAGSTVSYGRTFTTERVTKVAYIPVGYADGYPRLLSNRGKVIIRGIECPVVGRICMDWFMVDATGVPGVSPGDEVVLLGESKDGSITANEIAAEAQTIPYEILCKISSRIPRVYI